jgi:hypothetical protein
MKNLGKGYLKQIDRDEILFFQFFPETVEIARKVNYGIESVPGLLYNVIDYTSGESEEITFSLIFDDFQPPERGGKLPQDPFGPAFEANSWFYTSYPPLFGSAIYYLHLHQVYHGKVVITDCRERITFVTRGDKKPTRNTFDLTCRLFEEIPAPKMIYRKKRKKKKEDLKKSKKEVADEKPISFPWWKEHPEEKEYRRLAKKYGWKYPP